MTGLSGEQITELERRSETTTPRPWVWAVTGDRRWAQIDSGDPGGTFVAQCPDDDNAALIVAAVNAFPSLIESVRVVQRLEAENEQLTRRRGEMDEQYRSIERVRTVLYGTEWRGTDPLAMRDALRNALQDDAIAAAGYAEAAEARAAVQRARAAVQRVREQIAAEIEAYCRPRCDNRFRGDGGYNCCGCSTYDQIVDDAVRIAASGGTT